MAPQLCVIALISGGKDSFFAILHCHAQGHRTVALANLYPPVRGPAGLVHKSGNGQATSDDLNSFMYQTVGHNIIPLFEDALGIPLYRQEITGRAINEDVAYSVPPSDAQVGDSADQDEAESLLPLLRRVMQAHPEANAVSTGAILSDYQRTRVESVAVRLGLIPLSYLWQYPSLPPGTPTALLDDMIAVGQDARIIKVASGGLDASHLWENVASRRGVMQLTRAMSRFEDGASSGAVIGEGGEYETLTINGPPSLWKFRLEIASHNRLVLNEGSGSAILRITGAELVAKPEILEGECSPILRIPDLLDNSFDKLRIMLEKEGQLVTVLSEPGDPRHCSDEMGKRGWLSRAGHEKLYVSNMHGIEAGSDIQSQTESIVGRLRRVLSEAGRSPADIVFTTIILRSMDTFKQVNDIYATLFQQPNPPARVTFAAGNALPKGAALLVSIVVDLLPRSGRKGLHVQSRSYWAPANIGPYSQAISIQTLDPCDESGSSQSSVVYVAGQIPLVPASMDVVELPQGPLPKKPPHEMSNFRLQSLLALQHLWRIGRVMKVQWWSTCVALITGGHEIEHKALVAWEVWKQCNQEPEVSEEDVECDDIDIWDRTHGATGYQPKQSKGRHTLPDHDIIVTQDLHPIVPAFCAVQVEELPRKCEIEWAASGLASDRILLTESNEMDHSLQVVTWSISGPAIIHINLMDVLDVRETDHRLRELLAPQHLATLLKMPESETQIDHITIYTTRNLSVAAFGGSFTVIPCQRVWGREAVRCAAALTVRCSRVIERQGET